MRLLKLAPLVVPAFFATLTAADFHIFNCYHSYGLPNYDPTSGGQGDNSGLDAVAVAVPSNQYSCDGARYNPEIQGINGFVNWGTSYFNVQGLCGMDDLDFYWDGNGFNMYEGGGDGSVIGTCYQGSSQDMSCPAAFDELDCSDDWICYSWVCS